MTQPTSNREVAAVFRSLADLLEIRGEAPFKLTAYRRAAESIAQLPEPIAAVRSRHELEQLPGVGKAIAQKIEDLLDTGTFRLLDEVQAEIPPGVAELLQVPEVGPKRARLLYRELGIGSLEDLRTAVADGRLAGVGGLGPRGAQRIAEGLRALQAPDERIPLGVALPLAQELAALVRQASPYARRVEIAGSTRRFRDLVGNINLVAAADDGRRVLEAFCALPLVTKVLEANVHSCRVQLQNGYTAELCVAEDAAFGSLLQQATGSVAHNEHLVRLAADRRVKLSERGFEVDGRLVRCATEEQVYGFLGMQYVPPPMREDAGEVELALEGRLPDPFDVSWLQGDLHMHSDWSDGTRTIEAMALAARERGYEYICITDHSVSLGVAGGLSAERLARQREEIDALNHRLAPFRILQGVELEVRGDGSLDYPDEVLARLDVVTASVHSGLRKGREHVTSRALAAIRHPLVDVLAHPTGRLVGGRAGGDFDMDALYSEAARTGTALEINGDLARLDLRDSHARAALAAGCTLTIGSDAHSTEGLANVYYGAQVATRALARKEQVLTTLPLADLLPRLKRNRPAI
ncbi:MAG: DNA polymerase/3'-5' exonuclease PolX [Chloroflexota bacterium]|nr:DNA polymerase/3'-5' exonuclease PolX [Chloroflexota bacterium]